MRPVFERFLVLCSAVMLAACSSSSSAVGMDAGGPDSTAATFGSSACNACFSTACATQVTACNADPQCASYVICLDACSVGPTGSADPTCAASCLGSAPDQAETTLDACESAGAGAACAACGSSDAGALDAGAEASIVNENCPGDVDADNACNRCIDNSCCNARAACKGDPNCVAFVDCLGNCLSGVPDDAGVHDSGVPDAGGNQHLLNYECDLYCSSAIPGALTNYAPFQLCVFVDCSSACGESTACSDCTTQSCVSQWIASNATPEGYLLGDCAAACDATDTACVTACMNEYPSAVAALTALTNCGMTDCPACVAGQ